MEVSSTRHISKPFDQPPTVAAERSLELLYSRALLGSRRDLEKIKTLISQNAVDINTRQHPFGYTALHLAAFRNNLNVAQLLLEKGAKPNVPDNDRRTALFYAAARGYPEMISLLLSYGANDRLGFDEPFLSLLKMTIQNSWLEAFNMILTKLKNPPPEYREYMDLALYEAQSTPNLEPDTRQHMVRSLLAKGSDACFLNAESLVPLEESAEMYMLYVVHGLNSWDAFRRIKQQETRQLVCKGTQNLYHSLIETLVSIGVSEELFGPSEKMRFADSYKILRFMSYFPHWLAFNREDKDSVQCALQTIATLFKLPYEVMKKLCEYLDRPASMLSQFSKKRLHHNWLETKWTPIPDEISTATFPNP